ncbi:preprotein translocase subunit SecY [Candidatus Uhrbacteria bacterium RIFCSPHIGHO2_12_FULL_60_25]|uniref:Protein translocase subunit SecY n=1 Tax=Candidatus Uhrbacteria bacterium RIFCSPHIGHO2_12_FULL_60_25 TaxID=1802399 RepID=A0A1F7ULT2_9BACT|nr:MAG: preprotein translocase subunit SecY [Candidatus Uhrbacteria bacterium RIFCSPHIGHO2_02_FULL_60_44]OGL79236.1 MAG: preprotein translocase subunit SecY [Candidatus Uhrbacteria bacterium RIFCSPHIGHO2_12_FULL_60_25]
MWDKLKNAWKIPEVRNGMLFVMAMMVLFRVAAHIPLPGVDVVALRRFFEANQVLGLLNLFSGGTLENFSVVALGVAPYITASIIFQLLGMIVPAIEEIQKEGEAGQRKINQWTRLATVPLAIVQSFALISVLRSSGANILTRSDLLHLTTLILTVTAGTIFLMWIGELISEKKVGNGISLLIFAGIVASLPSIIQRAFITYDSSQLITYLAYVAVAIITVVGVVFITEGQRNVPVQYARQIRGTAMGGGVASTLPLRVNMSGVIPIIFAISIILFPSVVGQFFVRARTQWIADAANWLLAALQNQTIYGALYFVLVVGFTYFYTSVIFKPDQIAENLQKQGGFIPGIRPGAPTSSYLTNVLNRITLAGALFLGVIAVLPVMIQGFSGSSNFAIGGTSLLIVVSVVIESVKQIESQATMREYDVY